MAILRGLAVWSHGILIRAIPYRTDDLPGAAEAAPRLRGRRGFPYSIVVDFRDQIWRPEWVGLGFRFGEWLDLMIRYFLVLAVTGGSLLAADIVIGLLAAGEPRGAGAVWRGVHVLFSLLTIVALLGVHSIVYTYFMATVKWAKEVAKVYQLPDWMVGQATRNKKRVFRFIMGSIAAVAATAWLGAAVDTRGGGYGVWHLGVAFATLGFNLVSFVVEYAGIVAHHRLLAEVKARADQMRLERYGPEAVSV